MYRNLYSVTFLSHYKDWRCGYGLCELCLGSSAKETFNLHLLYFCLKLIWTITISTTNLSSSLVLIPINMEINWRLLYRLCSMRDCFVVSQLKHLTLKTNSIGISKMGSSIFTFSPWKLTEILGNLSRIHFIKNQQNCWLFNILVNYRYKEGRPHLGELIRL